MVFMIFSAIANSKLILKIMEIIFGANFGLFSIDTEIQEFSLSMISAAKMVNLDSKIET